MGHDIIVAAHVELCAHGRGRGDRGVDQVRELQPRPAREHAGIASSPGHPLVPVGQQSVGAQGVLHKAGDVAQRLAARVEPQGTGLAEICHRAGRRIPAAVVTVLQGEHQRLHLYDQLHRVVAMNRGNNGGAVKRRPLAANAEKDRGRATGCPECVVDVVGLLPGVGVRAVEVVHALRDESRRREGAAVAPGCPVSPAPATVAVHGPVSRGYHPPRSGRRGGGRGGKRQEERGRARHGGPRIGAAPLLGEWTA
mmetsp:Transcript_25075/g.72209  ORF Transcript_25075/g.72209 Transcript_25075/m.72209 type:complete len:253 (+) Transcript_25075:882-1640(+)